MFTISRDFKVLVLFLLLHLSAEFWFRQTVMKHAVFFLTLSLIITRCPCQTSHSVILAAVLTNLESVYFLVCV